MVRHSLVGIHDGTVQTRISVVTTATHYFFQPFISSNEDSLVGFMGRKGSHKGCPYTVIELYQLIRNTNLDPLALA